MGYQVKFRVTLLETGQAISMVWWDVELERHGIPEVVHILLIKSALMAKRIDQVVTFG